MIIVRSVASFESGLDEIVGIAVCKGTELPFTYLTQRPLLRRGILFDQYGFDELNSSFLIDTIHKFHMALI